MEMIDGVTVTKYTGVRAENREALIAGFKPYIGGVVFRFGSAPKPPDVFIPMPCCGEVRCWMDLESVPAHSVGPCSCGNWFIEYGAFVYK